MGTGSAKIAKSCPVCDKEFESWPAHGRIFCSRSCSDQGRKKPQPRKWPEAICEVCGTSFSYRQSSVTGKYCSRPCADKRRPGPPRHKKCTYYKGYRVIYSSDGRRILEHRWVMEQHIGRRLTSKEHIHHIDGDRSNNNIGNLEILTRSQHFKKHISTITEGQIRKRDIRGAISILKKPGLAPWPLRAALGRLKKHGITSLPSV